MLAAWVRDRLRHANSWCAALTQLRQVLGTERRTPATIERMFDVACATEYCDPDRGRALTLYLDAWRNGHAEAGVRAKNLATQLGAHMALAELAKADGDLLATGMAYLDAGFRELAAEPLQKFVDTRPAGASAVTENLRVEGVTALLSIAIGRRFDAEAEINDTLARARQATGRAACTAYLHAARVARASRLEDRIGSILAAATHACPEDDAIAALVEARLLEGGKTDELLAHYSKRLELTLSRAEYAERARAAGVQLIARNLQPGLGLRLLRMGLEHAYSALLPDITSHIAAWELLWTHAQVQQSTLDLIPLLEQALSAPLPEDDALYLAQLGLEISWRHASDIAGAKPYAAMLLDFVPDHPLAVAFVTDAAPEMIGEAEEEPLGMIDLPEAPPTPEPVKSSSRIPVLEGQVKRSEPAPSAIKKPHVITGRMALLKPAAPQPTPQPAPQPQLAPHPRAQIQPQKPRPQTEPKPQSQPLPTQQSQPARQSQPLQAKQSQPARQSQPLPARQSQPLPAHQSQPLPAQQSQPLPKASSQPLPKAPSQPLPKEPSQPLAKAPSQPLPKAQSQSQPPPPTSSPSPPSSSAHLMRSRRRTPFVPAPSRTTTAPRASESTYPPRAPRKVMPVDVVVELPNGNFFSTVLRDLSMSGAFVVTKRPLDVGAIVTLELKLPKPGSVTQTSHRVSARIARRTDIGCGVAFIDATPELVAALRAATE